MCVYIYIYMYIHVSNLYLSLPLPLAQGCDLRASLRGGAQNATNNNNNGRLKTII